MVMVNGIFTAFLPVPCFPYWPHNTHESGDANVLPVRVRCPNWGARACGRLGGRAASWAESEPDPSSERRGEGLTAIIRDRGHKSAGWWGGPHTNSVTWAPINRLSWTVLYLISISEDHFISTDTTQGGESRYKDLCTDIVTQFRGNKAKDSS